MFSIHAFTGIEAQVLVVMAFDCYVTICTPLHHMTILTSQVLVGITLYIIMCPNLLTLPVIYVIYCLCFCQFHIIIPQTYCEHMGTAKLSCGDFQFSSVQFSSVQSLSSPTLCNPMDCSMLNFLVHHQLLEAIQTHVH